MNDIVTINETINALNLQNVEIALCYFGFQNKCMSNFNDIIIIGGLYNE